MQKQTSSGVLGYKCPNCGAGISFSAELGLFACEYCMSKFTQQEMDEYDRLRQQKEEARIKNAASKEANARASDEVVHTYNCNSCGAQVVTTETTTATFCYYCHSPVIIESRLFGDDRPDEIIPFSISEEVAKQKFLQWTENKKFIPDDFRSESHIEKMTGIYIPYWYLDSDVDVNFVGQSSRSVTTSNFNYRITETSDYQHHRRGTFQITDVNLAASSKIDINLLNGIEPFDSEKIQLFSMPLLSGFFAESYTVPEDAGTNELKRMAEAYSDAILSRSFEFTGSLKTLEKNFAQREKDTRYVLLPVWVLTYNYNGKIYVFAVNGDSGKTSGELPIVESKLNAAARRVALTTGIAAFIIVLLVLFLWWYLM